MKVFKCDMCGEITGCTQVMIDGKSYDFCQACKAEMDKKLEGKGEPLYKFVFTPQPVYPIYIQPYVPAPAWPTLPVRCDPPIITCQDNHTLTIDTITSSVGADARYLTQ